MNIRREQHEEQQGPEAIIHFLKAKAILILEAITWYLILYYSSSACTCTPYSSVLKLTDLADCRGTVRT